MDDLEEDDACGLDLGTTFSCIGVYKNGGVKIIPNRYGDKTTPSIVTILDKDNILRGEETLDNLVKDYDSSIYAVKRFLGRDFNDKEVKEEMEKGNFPFKFVLDEGHPSIEFKKNKETFHFKLEEISSYVIRKMVDSAEDFLEKSINKLVITVPYNFNDAQRKCTEQAAEIAGVKVLRFINEPTAAALAYRLDEKNDNNGNILIFDLGGGTFDVTLLSINKDVNNKDIFNVLSTKGEKFLGGEDFDNKLVEYFLDKFCEKMNLKKEDVKKDKKAIRKLKISCEKIKRVLSSTEETQLYIYNFYDNKDILEKISCSIFEFLCKDLIEKLRKPLLDVISDAKISKNDISEIVLVGGSTRLKMVRRFINKFFNGCKIKINDTINPDEAIAYGATLMAAKISKKKIGSLAGFNLMDITPLSLGIETHNDSKDSKVRDRGLLMSVIIKRGVKIPHSNTRTYWTVSDYQTSAKIAIYEGEKKYVNENHKLGEVIMSNLTKKPKGEVKIDINFYIDVNGILTVTGTEKDKKNNKILIEIKNDNVNLTREEVEKLRQKNEKYQNMNPNLTLDYNNLKKTLREFQKIYDTSTNDNEKYNILMSYNSTLEEFIDLFNKDKENVDKNLNDNFDNETMIEKYFLYIQDLFKSYSKTLNNSQIQNEDQQNIINKMKEYIQVFISKCSGYLKDLVESIKDFPLKIFYEIIIFIMENYNKCGKNCLKAMKKFCRYNSLTYFENALMYFKSYIKDLGNVLKNCHKKDYDNCKLQKETSEQYIDNINSDAILLCEDSFKKKKLSSTGSGFSIKNKGLSYGAKEEKEKYEIVLYNYEKMLISLKGKTNEEEAICIANIVKINAEFLEMNNTRNILELAEKCEFIVKKKKLDKNSEWYTEFKDIYDKLKDQNNTLIINTSKERIRTKYSTQFDEIEDNYENRKSNVEFIDFILKKKPYPQYEEDKRNKVVDFSKESSELYKLLTQRYHPNEYTIEEDDEQSLLNYLLIDNIEAKLNNLNEKLK